MKRPKTRKPSADEIAWAYKRNMLEVFRARGHPPEEAARLADEAVLEQRRADREESERRTSRRKVYQDLKARGQI